MKFNCPKRTPRDDTLWHKWFAWYPVRVGDNDCRWLETVYRKAIPRTYANHDDWQRYEYREYD